MAVAQALLAASGERSRGLDYVLDLAAVDFLFSEVAELVARETAVGHVRTVHLVEESDPDRAPRLCGEVMVPQRDVDARLESLVEYAHTVCRHEEDAAEVPDTGKCSILVRAGNDT